LLDLFVLGRSNAERARYEARTCSLRHSDLFGIGPVTECLREHPRGDRPRAVFFGNSIVWGYRLPEQDSLPVQFQRRNPSTRVLNFAVNRFGIGSAALWLKDVVDSVDLVVLHAYGRESTVGWPIIPVSNEDVARYRLDPPDRVEQRFEAALGFWRLYGLSYRLQMAWLGTSTRYYVYLHKSSLTGRKPIEDYAPNPPATAGPRVLHAIADADLPAARLRELAAADPMLWKQRAWSDRTANARLSGRSTTRPGSERRLDRSESRVSGFVHICDGRRSARDDDGRTSFDRERFGGRGWSPVGARRRSQPAGPCCSLTRGSRSWPS
jgi:hypothetical protein